MGRLPGGGWSTETLGDLIDEGGGLYVYCANRPDCGRQLDCDVYDLAIWFGRRQKFVRTRLPLKCARCGGKRFEFTVMSESRPAEVARKLEPKNFRSDRSPEDRRALMVVFPRQR